MQVPAPADPRPAYVQIADDLRSRIGTGDLGPPARMPTLREMSETYRVAIETVRRAVAVLADEGLVSTGSTRGMFVLKKPGEPASSPDYLRLAETVARQGDLLEDLRDEVRGLRDQVLGREGHDAPR